MKCPKCGSENVNVQAINEVKSRGCMMVLINILLTICTGGIWLIVILVRGSTRSKTKSYAVCQECGKRWKV